MAGVKIAYSGTLIAEMDAQGIKTLHTSGKYCKDNIQVAYDPPSGGDDSWVNRIAGSGTIKWPSGITEIPAYLFYNVKTGDFVFDELPDSVEKVGESAFYSSYVRNMNITKLPANLITLKNYCFRSIQFEFSVIPAGVESIGSQAFYFNLKLKEITFRGTPTSIDTNAFAQCGNLLTINVPWAEGEVKNAPWGATNATINYNYVEEG